MTQALIVLVSAVAALMFVDPFYSGALSKSTVARVVVLVLGYGALFFHCMGRAAVAPERFQAALRETLVAWWPLIVLALYVLAGSLYARFAAQVPESFLSMGLGMLFLPLFALAVRSSDDPISFMKTLAVVYVLAVMGSFGVLISGLYVFHEKMWLVVPLGAYFICGGGASLWRLVLGLALVALCVLSVKNTTFLIMLAVLAACGLVLGSRLLKRFSAIGAVLAVLVLVPIVLIGLSLLGYSWWSHRELLPTGNVEYRVEMNRIAWRLFEDSPLWGTAFTDASVFHFTLYRIDLATQYLPTHNDILDLLAHGGLIAFGLWLMVIWRLFRIGVQTVRKLAAPTGPADLRPWRWLFVLGMIQLGAVITYAVNPILISPLHAFWLWGGAGVMWALHMQLTAKPLPARETYASWLAKTAAS